MADFFDIENQADALAEQAYLDYMKSTTQNNVRTFCLFSDRHELPENEGAICSKFDFDTFEVEKTALWEQAISCENVRLYVTGLIPALTQFISEWAKNNYYVGILILLHYNKDKKEYVEQIVF